VYDKVKTFKRAARRNEELGYQTRIEAFVSEDWKNSSAASERYFNVAITMYSVALQELKRLV